MPQHNLLICSRCGKRFTTFQTTQTTSLSSLCTACSRRAQVERQIYDLLTSTPGWILLDSVTTGLVVGSDEVIDVAILNSGGETLFSSLIRPQRHLLDGSQAQGIHHITDAEIRTAPTLMGVWPDIVTILVAAPLVIAYNAAYDRGMLKGDASHSRLPFPEPPWWWDLMDAYARWHGEYSSIHGSYRWQSLKIACQTLEIETNSFATEHRALGDAQRAYAVLAALAARVPQE